MKFEKRKEIRNAVIIFSLFNLVNLIVLFIGQEISILHFVRGALAGMAFVEVLIGLLPESAYLSIKNFKKTVLHNR